MTIAVATRNQGEAQLVADAHGTKHVLLITGQFVGGALLPLEDASARGGSTFASRMAQHR